MSIALFTYPSSVVSSASRRAATDPDTVMSVVVTRLLSVLSEPLRAVSAVAISAREFSGVLSELLLIAATSVCKASTICVSDGMPGKTTGANPSATSLSVTGPPDVIVMSRLTSDGSLISVPGKEVTSVVEKILPVAGSKL